MIVVKPGTGINDIKLGMFYKEVESSFQESIMYEDWMGGNQNGNLLYHGMIMYFNTEQILSEIFINENREDVFLFGKTRGFWRKENIISELKLLGGKIYNHISGDVLSENPNLGLTFSENGVLSEISIFLSIENELQFSTKYEA